MTKNQSRPILNRRDFLKLPASGGGLTAAGGHALYTYTPWLNYEDQANQNRKPFEKNTTMSAEMVELVRYATLAPNGHNTQPWKFAIRENAIEIHPDLTRHLPAVDPNERELWISLGCALENLIVSARAIGYEAEVTCPDAADFFGVDLTTNVPQGGTLFDSIPLRQNTRSEYDGQPIKTSDLDDIQTLPMDPGVALHFVSTPADIEKVLEYVNQGNLIQYVIITLAPLVIIGAVGLLLIMLAPISWLLMIIFFVALNTGGSMGDIFVFICLLKFSPICYVNDTGDVVTFFELQATV